MKKALFLLMVFAFHAHPGKTQDTAWRKPLGLTAISQVNQGNSYITFPTDIGNLEPLWFEANLIPNFNIRKSKNSRVMGVLTPQIILRMYQEESYPVRTPSYMPHITVYYRITEKEKARGLSLFGRLKHHSNGQQGSFFTDSSEINRETGNFASNKIEGGVILSNTNTRFKAYQFFASSIEVYPWNVDELDNIYSKFRWNNTFSVFKLPFGESNSKQEKAVISMKVETSWMFGDVNNWNNFSLDRLNLGLTIHYLPKFLEDIGFFVHYYHGQDYYNIYFDHQLDVIRFGLMTEKLRF
jgi:hypothetical protein